MNAYLSRTFSSENHQPKAPLAGELSAVRLTEGFLTLPSRLRRATSPTGEAGIYGTKSRYRVRNRYRRTPGDGCPYSPSGEAANHCQLSIVKEVMSIVSVYRFHISDRSPTLGAARCPGKAACGVVSGLRRRDLRPGKPLPPLPDVGVTQSAKCKTQSAKCGGFQRGK